MIAWAVAGGGDGRGAGGAAAVAGSGVMILTGGVEAALGNSALVGLPMGNDDGAAATGAAAAATGAAGAFQDDE